MTRTLVLLVVAAQLHGRTLVLLVATVGVFGALTGLGAIV